MDDSIRNFSEQCDDKAESSSMIGLPDVAISIMIRHCVPSIMLDRYLFEHLVPRTFL